MWHPSGCSYVCFSVLTSFIVLRRVGLCLRRKDRFYLLIQKRSEAETVNWSEHLNPFNELESRRVMRPPFNLPSLVVHRSGDLSTSKLKTVRERPEGSRVERVEQCWGTFLPDPTTFHVPEEGLRLSGRTDVGRGSTRSSLLKRNRREQWETPTVVDGVSLRGVPKKKSGTRKE